MTNDNSQLDCSESIWISNSDRQEMYETESLSFDPFDPRRMYAIIRECASRWLIQEADLHAAAGSAIDVEPEIVWSEPSTAGHVLELRVNSARIGISAVGRFDTAYIEDRYLIPDSWGTEASICAVLPILVMEEEDGAVNVFLHGWAAPGESILQSPGEAALQEGYAELNLTGLHPLDTLFDHLRQTIGDGEPPGQDTPVEHIQAATAVARQRDGVSKHSTRLKSGLAVSLVSCAVTAAILMLTVFPGPSESVSFDFITGESVRSAARPSVRSGQSYSVNFRLQTALQRGWLYQFDGQSGQLLATGRQNGGTIILTHSDTFNHTRGVEYFVAVFSDRDLDLLNQSGAVAWLDERELHRLQTFDAFSRDADTEATLTRALREVIGEAPGIRMIVRSVDHTN